MCHQLQDKASALLVELNKERFEHNNTQQQLKLAREVHEQDRQQWAEEQVAHEVSWKCMLILLTFSSFSPLQPCILCSLTLTCIYHIEDVNAASHRILCLIQKEQAAASQAERNLLEEKSQLKTGLTAALEQRAEIEKRLQQASNELREVTYP